jgi:hypothetical protein
VRSTKKSKWTPGQTRGDADRVRSTKKKKQTPGQARGDVINQTRGDIITRNTVPST